MQHSQPLAQDYAVIARVPEDTDDCYTFFLSDAFIRLSDGTMVAGAPMVQAGPGASKSKAGRVRLARSRDGGSTWEALDDVLFERSVEAAFFAHAGALFMIAGLRSPEGPILVLRSDDQGSSWTRPVQVATSPNHRPDPGLSNAAVRADADGIAAQNVEKNNYFYCLHQTPMVVKDNRLYLAVSEACQQLAMLVCDLAQDPLQPAAWRIGSSVKMPIPVELNAGLYPGPSMGCLEGNVIEVNGKLRVLARACIDRYATANLAAVYDVQDKGGRLDLTFTQFYPVPGGNCKFYIIHDKESGLYWMASNPPANSQGVVPSPLAPVAPGNDRRFLMLWYALDALNWFPAGCVAYTEKLTECFMYPSMAVDGEDLVILSRTAHAYADEKMAVARARKGWHDANMLTLHRVRNFRSLAMPIRPQV